MRTCFSSHVHATAGATSPLALTNSGGILAASLNLTFVSVVLSSQNTPLNVLALQETSDFFRRLLTAKHPMGESHFNGLESPSNPRNFIFLALLPPLAASLPRCHCSVSMALIAGSVPVNAFPNLTRLRILGCKTLASLSHLNALLSRSPRLQHVIWACFGLSKDTNCSPASTIPLGYLQTLQAAVDVRFCQGFAVFWWQSKGPSTSSHFAIGERCVSRSKRAGALLPFSNLYQVLPAAYSLATMASSAASNQQDRGVLGRVLSSCRASRPASDGGDYDGLHDIGQLRLPSCMHTLLLRQ
ncbi:hypothetical protein OBBRIDRAFT_641709 [Obba rivulosa]|uniref:Uncharacterized protein n=1 Tax=Obba rivulosa TaxID=1052685 RepID=A0A8E2DSW6_9APHY|nr:hypothetical protein OBBRIDRAFT_641709 [Obba rivulosa]